MKSRLVLFMVFGLCFIFLIMVCEKVSNLLNPKKPAQEAATAPLAVKGPIIAKVNNFPITLEDLEQEVKAYNTIVPADKPEAKITTRDQKVNYLKTEMVRRAILYQEALARGLDRNEDVLRALEKTKQDLLILELVRQETDKVDVPSSEIEDYYNTYKEQLKEPEERQIREIVLSTEQEAKDILIQLLQGADFAALAKERSKSSSAKDGGDLGFLEKGKKPAQFDAVAFSDSLDAGKISSIFKGPDGYYILKIEEI